MIICLKKESNGERQRHPSCIHKLNFLHSSWTHGVCLFVYVCACVCVWFVFPALPGSRGAACAGRWIVLLGCGVAVSWFVWRMDVGDRGQAYHRVTSQTTGCHAPQSMTCPPPRGLKKTLLL